MQSQEVLLCLKEFSFCLRCKILLKTVKRLREVKNVANVPVGGAIPIRGIIRQFSNIGREAISILIVKPKGRAT